MARAVFHLTDGEQLTCHDADSNPEHLADFVADAKWISYLDGPRTQIVFPTQITHIEHYETGDTA